MVPRRQCATTLWVAGGASLSGRDERPSSDLSSQVSQSNSNLDGSDVRQLRSDEAGQAFGEGNSHFLGQQPLTTLSQKRPCFWSAAKVFVLQILLRDMTDRRVLKTS